MTGTEQVLARLPAAFDAETGSPVLRALVSALAGELPMVENALAAVMRAHWVDLADAGEDQIDDLARMAALYGLVPGADEQVEEFREHLKRYVRTFLDGTVTVPGLLRVTAEALGLRIPEPAGVLAAWWTRRADRPEPVVEPDAADAAWLLFGGHPAARGEAARGAVLAGRVDLRGGADLRAASTLTLAVDGGAALTVDLAAGAADPAAVPIDHLVAALNATFGPVASAPAGRLELVAPTSTGPGSRLELRPGTGDATQAVLGLPPRVAAGAPARAAVITGASALPDPVPVGAFRYLRLAVDGGAPAEIDLAAGAGPDPASMPRGSAVDAINEAFPGLAELTGDGRLRLRSPVPGGGSRIDIPRAPAQDAADLLFGSGVARTAFGAGPEPARLVGTAVLPALVDLRSAWRLRITLDGGGTVDVDVRGMDPAATTPAEIAAAVNVALGAPVALFAGGRLTLSSPRAGPASRVEVGEPDHDAASVLLGLAPLSATGAAARPAELATRELPDPLDVSARYRLAVRVDDEDLAVVDLRPEGADPAAVPLASVASTMDSALGVAVAVRDGHLAFTTGTAGADATLTVEPLARTTIPYFASWLPITDDAAPVVLGQISASAVGTPGTAATVIGVELPLGSVDLRAAHRLRLLVNEGPPVDVDCAGRRPRYTTPAEIAEKINAALAGAVPVAAVTGNRVVLRSPTTGAASRLAFGTPEADDALGTVLGGGPRLARGSEANGVSFVGLRDLSGGIALPADAALAVGVDGADPVQVPVGDPVLGTRTPQQLVFAINTALAAAVAAHDDVHLLLTTPQRDGQARLVLTVPDGPDATETLLGVAAPREYRGAAAMPARLTGEVPLPELVDLSAGRSLRLAVDGGPPFQVDLVGDADPAAVPRDALVAAINAAAATAGAVAAGAGTGPDGGAEVAAIEGDRLVLTSPSTGVAARIEVLRAVAGEAKPLIFGDPPAETRGTDPAPAEIVGTVDLGSPVNLSRGGRLRLTVDGGAPVVVDVAGPDPAVTTLPDVVAAIESVVPGLAHPAPGGRLALRAARSVVAGPARYLGVVEYPAVSRTAQGPVRHATALTVRNAGILAAPVRVEVSAPGGLAGPGFVDPATHWAVRLLDIIAPGETARFTADRDGSVRVAVGVPGRPPRDVPAGALRIRRVTPAAAAAFPPENRPDALVLPAGTTHLLFLESRADRFDGCDFNAGRFAGGPWREAAVFDVSEFDGEPAASFADTVADHGAVATAAWQAHEPGSVDVHLPADLARRYGGRFDTAVFGGPDPHGPFPNLATDPPYADADHLTTALRDRSALVTAEFVDELPLGFRPVELPTPGPVPLRLGRLRPNAALYLADPGFDGRFVRVSARRAGPAGAGYAFTAERDGPGTYTVQVSSTGDRFECARATAEGDPVPEQAAELTRPSRIGVRAARAAGVRVRVTRDRADDQPTPQRSTP